MSRYCAACLALAALAMLAAAGCDASPAASSSPAAPPPPSGAAPSSAPAAAFDGSAPSPAASPAPLPTVAPAPEHVAAYYVHGDRRCRTCLGMQRVVELTIRERFAAELAAGTVVFREINTDQEANKAFAEQYGVAFSTLIVAAKRGGATVKWENADQVWTFAHDHPALAAYVEERVRAMSPQTDAR